MRRRTLLFLALLVLAGCGGGSASRPAASTAAAKRCHSPAAARARARLRRDVVAIRRAARLRTRDTLKGNAAVNVATDRFLSDLARSRLDLLEQNRFIDHAAGALAGACEQCFQALEAGRPIPGIAHAGRCGAR